jgi:putative restriction endonuclease
MIHFEQQREGGKVFYWASWPVFASQDFPDNDYVKISAAILSVNRSGKLHEIAEPQRSYSEKTTMYREHQKGFRASVLRAYATRCAICRLELPTLIEVAHIIPDREDKGEPVVPNGIALCKIHHAAFDSNILGLRPAARGHAPVITIKDSIMSISDGPMLLHGIQEMNNVAMTLPEASVDHPDNERLEIRYERFKAAI